MKTEININTFIMCIISKVQTYGFHYLIFETIIIIISKGEINLKKSSKMSLQIFRDYSRKERVQKSIQF